MKFNQYLMSKKFISCFFVITAFNLIAVCNNLYAGGPSKKETKVYIENAFNNDVRNSQNKFKFIINDCNIIINNYFCSGTERFIDNPTQITIIPLIKTSNSINEKYDKYNGNFRQINFECNDGSNCIVSKINYEDKSCTAPLNQYYGGAATIDISDAAGRGKKAVKALDHMRELCGGQKELF